MPFGYNPLHNAWKCPVCKSIHHFRQDRFAIEYMEKNFIPKHMAKHSVGDSQVDLYGGALDYMRIHYGGREIDAMKIPKSKLEGKGSFLKPTEKDYGKVESFTATADIESNNNLYSIPVKSSGHGEGNYSLNKTSLQMFNDVLHFPEDNDGNVDTSGIVGASWTSMAIPKRNPQLNKDVPAWSIVSGSIVAPKKSR